MLLLLKVYSSMNVFHVCLITEIIPNCHYSLIFSMLETSFKQIICNNIIYTQEHKGISFSSEYNIL